MDIGVYVQDITSTRYHSIELHTALDSQST